MTRYTIDQLLQLRQSPLVVKPPGLPSTDEWMGPPPDTPRKQTTARNHDVSLLDHTTRRTGHRNANPEDIILGPPKTSFASATAMRTARPFESPDRPTTTRDNDTRDRFNFRRMDDDRMRDTRSKFKRPDDEDGWSTVKPRKSFGAEGAERFNGRMGGERIRGEALGYGEAHRPGRFKDRDERDAKDVQRRGFDVFGKELDDRKRDAGRSKADKSWFRDAEPPVARDRNSNGDRLVDRTRGWRERDDRPTDRRDRHEMRHEQDPEWMDDPADEKFTAHTQEDFQRWKEKMKAGTTGTPVDPMGMEKPANEDSFFGLEKLAIESPPPLVIDAGPDKFFATFGKASADEAIPAVAKENNPKAMTMGKSSRFTSFFSAPHEEQRFPEPQAPPPNGLVAILQQSKAPTDAVDQDAEERKAFAQIIQKLQSQGAGGSTSAPPTKMAIHPRPILQGNASASPPPMSNMIHAFRTERPEEPRPGTRHSQQQALQELLTQRANALSQPSTRPEQVLQDLVNNRQNTLSQSSNRPEQGHNRNAEFLMGLMQNSRPPPELAMRMPPPQPMPQMDDRDDMLREDLRDVRGLPRSRPAFDGPPGLYDEPAFVRGMPPQVQPQPPQSQQPPPPMDNSGRPQPQPTQILQRPPPGLEPVPPGWPQQNNQIPPPQQRHIAPPPGLPGRGLPPMQGMFPPGFPGPGPGMGGPGGPGGPLGGFPPPESLPAMPRNMQPLPPGFYPPGFLPPPMNAFGPPEGMAFGPFDGRGGPPQGNFRRQ